MLDLVCLLKTNSHCFQPWPDAYVTSLVRLGITCCTSYLPVIGGSTVGNLAMKLQVEVYKEENYIRLYTGCGSWHEINQLYTFTF
jgi:hypothetical protein